MARPAATRPTDAELAILGVLWDRGPSTVREVHAILFRDRPAGYALPPAHLAEDRSGLAVRHGEAAAGRIMQAREDALVVIRGRLQDAGTISTTDPED